MGGTFPCQVFIQIEGSIRPSCLWVFFIRFVSPCLVERHVEGHGEGEAGVEEGDGVRH